jgi:acyl-CoA carboxylase subunit alpha
LPIRKILIANRGEIALRIARTCREIGISPVVIYSQADRDAPHTRAADQAIDIGANYLNIENIIDAARSASADAIHPGYGFLAENADFAEACRAAGLTFIGPTPEAIRRMGLKTNARQIATSVGVPIVPSFEPTARLEYPVLIKASAGGGGRGMRIVTAPEQLHDALASAASEAERAFGDGSLLIERYIEGSRHVEFQIFGDLHGNLIHLFERDCSIQRRHQKIIEESPSPALDDDLRNRMGQAAIAIGRAIGYTNAGTVEFLLAPSGDFYFIEVNTRLQVEHPVTELVTGLDLVRLQIEVAEGKCLPPHPRMLGHAIEARLNAEDPVNGFLPSTGTVHVWRPPENVRVDTALESGAEVGIHYDPLLAKIVSYGPDREAARRKLVYALRSTVVFGVQTNRDYLIQLLETDEFRNGVANTSFLPAPLDPPDVDDYIAAAVLYLNRSPARGVPPNYRNNPHRDPHIKLRANNQDLTVSWKHLGKDSWNIEIPRLGKEGRGARTLACRVHTHVNAAAEITLTLSGKTQTYQITEHSNQIFVHSPDRSTTLTRLPRHPRPSTAGQRETANSPMPGQVLRILVREGQPVKPGDSLVVLEAMKMEQTIRTTINGVVQSILVDIGQVVAPGQMLVQINAQEIS